MIADVTVDLIHALNYSLSVDSDEWVGPAPGVMK